MNRAAEQTQGNPLREGLSTRAVPQPCSVVIFGATGDLTHRKLLPALYNLAADGELPPAVTVIGFARRESTGLSARQRIPLYLLRDRDRIFGDEFGKDVQAMGIEEVLSAPPSPWQGA